MRQLLYVGNKYAVLCVSPSNPCSVPLWGHTFPHQRQENPAGRQPFSFVTVSLANARLPHLLRLKFQALLRVARAMPHNKKALMKLRPQISYSYDPELTINIHLPASLRNLLSKTAAQLRSVVGRPKKKLRAGLEVIEKMSAERKEDLCLSRQEAVAALEAAASLAYMLSVARKHFDEMPLAVIVLGEIAPLKLTRRILPPSSQVWGTKEVSPALVFNYETIRTVLKSQDADIPVARGFTLGYAITRLEANDPAITSLRDDLAQGAKTYAYTMRQLAKDDFERETFSGTP
jgi:hypothetical protein